jgi:hypothetical protein
MNDVNDFIVLVREELGLPIEPEVLDTAFDDLDSWDSVHLLKLLGVVESASGKSVSVPRVLRARSLREVYEVVSS